MDEKVSNELYRIQCQLVGERYAGATFAKIVMGDVEGSRILEYMKNPKKFLIYTGAPGIGKTYFCSSLIPWIHGKVNSYYYIKETNFLVRLRECIDKGWDYSREITNWLDHDFLIFDDLGSAGFTEWRAEVLFALIDYRYESMKPTVFTSNLSHKSLTAGLGERATSRLFATENVLINGDGKEDFRLKGW